MRGTPRDMKDKSSAPIEEPECAERNNNCERKHSRKDRDNEINGEEEEEEEGRNEEAKPPFRLTQ